MTAAVACSECGSPLYAEDRFCGACGRPATATPSGSHAVKLLAELRAVTVGEYEIRGEIGRGGMAVVYLAYDLRLNRKVAIKVMLPELSFHAGMEERFKREARTAARLDHPNIVVIYSVRDAGQPLFFVMKYVDGAPLDAVIRGHGALPIPLVQGLLLQLCAALQYAHRDGVVHRDVKPANILVDSRGNLQVTDFGIAKALDSVQLTQTGMAIGTPAYMSPEQCTGHPQSAASDQYSVGVVAYELLTGHAPFNGSTFEIQLAHVKDEPRPISAVRPDCPPTLSAAITRMLAKDPGERWPALRDAMPLIAGGSPVDTDAGRLGLAELVRTSPPTRPSFALTPMSPVPHQVPPRPSPVTPVAAPTPVSVPPIASIEVSPRQCSVDVGTTERIRCRVRDSQGHEVSDTPHWSSSNPKIASVDDAGLVTAHVVGAVTIAAMIGSVASMVHIEVVPATVGRVDVEPSVVSLAARASVRLTVRAYSTKAKLIVNSPVTFKSVDPSVAELDASGSLTGVSRGTTTAVVTVGGVNARVIITVTPALTSEFTATPRAAKRRPVRWLAAAGVVIAIALGSWAIARKANDSQPIASTASTGAVATIPVPPPAVRATTPAPAAVPAAPVAIPADTVVAAFELTEQSPMPVAVGETKRLVAKVSNRRGEVLPTARVEWEASNPAVATVDSGGVLIAVAPGRTLITAKVGERTRVLAVDVQPSVVASVAAPIARDSLQPSDSTTASAPAGPVPSEAEAQAVADSIIVMIGRQVVRMSLLLRTAGDAGTQFQGFLETNSPSAKLAGAPSVSSVSATNAKVAVGLVLQYEKAEARRERTVNIECLLEAVPGGWAIREIRFPNGFTP